jgi:hypothetical protein
VAPLHGRTAETAAAFHVPLFISNLVSATPRALVTFKQAADTAKQAIAHRISPLG